MDRKEYLKNYKREWYQKVCKIRRNAWLDANGPCAKCGSWDRLEVDHVNPKNKDRPGDHRVWSWSEEKRLIELAKCQVLCCDCHIEKHRVLRSILIHGTWCMYTHHGCRCKKCKKANTIKSKKYRERKMASSSTLG